MKVFVVFDFSKVLFSCACNDLVDVPFPNDELKAFNAKTSVQEGLTFIDRR